MQTRTLMLLAMTWTLSACGDEKLIDVGGLPSQLGKAKCAGSVEDMIRAYPDLTLEKSDQKTAVYCRVTPGVEKHCAFALDGKVVMGTVFFMPEHELYDFGKTLPRLEKELGKGVFDPIKKTVRWSTASKSNISLTSTKEWTSLVANCP